ncbi:hypothetical protein EV178_005911 [Coemansia sp. RSA 1646]|nr:hypothetical protein EV178_005911 [Coemansia sp. RSA 1646]
MAKDSHPYTESKDDLSLVVHALVGLFSLNMHSYILVATDSKKCGAIGGCDIYEVGSVIALPLDYQSGKAKLQAWRHSNPEPSQEKTDNLEHEDSGTLSIDPFATWISPQITKMFGRSRAESAASSANESTFANQLPSSGSAERMERRIVEEIVRLFGSSGIFYSYEYDMTRSLQAKEGQLSASGCGPLSQAACPDYWFNHHLLQLLIGQNAQGWTLPMIQGCAQAATCTAFNGDAFQVFVISRRRVQRIGMRYERRGANADGFVANSVETEQILTIDTGSQGIHYCSFVQTRGSIPFLWKQPSSGLHPVPVVVGSEEDNAAICAAHLQREIKLLGRQVLVNLVEHKGREAVVGSKYASLVGICVAEDLVDARCVRYVPWDFHHETRGMRFENIKQLVLQLQHEISNMGYFWHSGKQALTSQQGVFRVNCMDCLDRTNVVQSALARFVLNEQLIRLGVHAAPERGLAAYDGLEQMLNHLWANNGDYISRQYAGTSAMKGDFTRTGKRNIGGVVSDASYSIARLWISTFRDYFSQSVLDFIAGNHNAEAVYRTLIELRSNEPDHAIQLTRARGAAIESSVAIVVNDGEIIQIACIVQSPILLNTIRAREEDDAVLILTNSSVYICRYHYQMEKVTEFICVDLARLHAVQHGAYITDTRTPQSLDPAHNHGIVLFFEAAVARFNSGSEQNVSSIGTSASPNPQLEDVSGDISASDSKLNQTQGYLACKIVSKSQVIMQQLPDQTQIAAPAVDVAKSSNEEHTNTTNACTTNPQKDGILKASLVRLDSFAKQPPEMLAEFITSAILSLKAMQDPTLNGKQFIANSPIVSEADARQNVNIIEKVSNRIHKAFWI